MIRMFSFWKSLVAVPVLLTCMSARAFDRDVHYYVNFMVALDSGFSVGEATELATLTQYTDENDATEPGKIFFGAAQRRTYHFPCDMYDKSMTIHDGRFARHNINKAFRGNDKYMLAIGLHVYADSWSHETYGSEVGHLFAAHEPDRPYKRVGTFMEMCRQVYTVMQWYRHINNLPEVARRATDQDLADTARLGTECSWFSSYETAEIAPRCGHWTSTIARVFSVAASYTAPQGALLGKFNSVVGAYSLPKDSHDCYNAQWDSPTAKKTAALRNAATAPRAAAKPDYNKILAKLTGKSTTFIARYLVAHPGVIADARIQALIVGPAGLNALVKQAKNEKRMLAVMHILLACDWTGVAYLPVLAANLQSTSFYIRLLAVNLLLQSGNVTADMGAEINALYNAIDLTRLSKAKTKCLLDAMVLDEALIAGPATNTVNLLDKLLKDRRFAHLAAAKLYTIGCEEIPATNPVAGEETLRQVACNSLRRGSPADVKNPGMLRYWQVRSYADFDDNANGTPTDMTNLFFLIGVLNQAIAAQDVDMIQAAASAFSTYGVADNPAPAVTDALTQALAAAPAEAKWQIGYALEQLTGVTFDLTPSGLADFDRQWRQEFSAKATRP